MLFFARSSRMTCNTISSNSLLQIQCIWRVILPNEKYGKCMDEQLWSSAFYLKWTYVYRKIDKGKEKWYLWVQKPCKQFPPFVCCLWFIYLHWKRNLTFFVKKLCIIFASLIVLRFLLISHLKKITLNVRYFFFHFLKLCFITSTGFLMFNA